MPLPPVTFPTLGWTVADWIEAMLCHGPGDVQGEPYHLTDERTLFLCWAYRLYPQGHAKAGRRMIHHGVLSRAKGWAKSEFAGAIVCAEALGPVRFGGWDAAGEPVGVPVTYPFIRCMATEEEQSGNTYDNVTYMLGEGAAANEYALDIGLTRTYIKESGGGEIVPSTSGDASKDGGKESFAVADETHLYVLPGLKRMYSTVQRNTGKRAGAEPWMLDTTTAWQPGERSIAEGTFEKFGDLPAEEAVVKGGVLIDHRQGPAPARFGDDRSLIKAMRESYGDESGRMDYERIVRIVRDAEDPEADAYRFFLNRPRAGVSVWLQTEEITAVLGEVRPEKGDPITLGFDGSDVDDHTALMGCTKDGDLFTVGIWCPTADDLGWRDEVDAAVDWAFEHFKVERMYADPPWWIDYLARWAGRHGRRRVLEFWTNVDSKTAVACGALRTAVRNKAIIIDPEPIKTAEIVDNGRTLLRQHFENARTRKVRIKLDDKAEEAYTVRKERPGSPLKIDGVLSSALARAAYDHVIASGGFKARRPQQLQTFSH